MSARVGRRAVLAGAAAFVAVPRIGPATAAPAASLASILADAGLGQLTGCTVVEVGGEVLESHQPDLALPPASVAKVVTTLYALDALGPAYRFRTEIRGDGPLVQGTLRGDLTLVGGGDPVLDTDALGDLVRALRVSGLRAVEGGLRIDAGALPAIAEVAADQPEDAGYNPAISGVNLNFNRVLLEWSPGATGPELRFGAPGRRYAPATRGFGVELAQTGPTRQRTEDGRETWTLARPTVRGRGSDWLPVRDPVRYADEVFRALSTDAGVALASGATKGASTGGLLALHDSPPLERMMRDMLYYSTNLTAEAAGLRASQVRGLTPRGLAASASAMTAWVHARYGLERAVFVNHSGLDVATRLPASEMTEVLVQAADRMPALLRARPILDAQRQPVAIAGVEVVSKTGTLDFVSALAGYITGRRQLAFAIFTADTDRRARIRPDQRDAPPGAAAWAVRARAQQQALLRRWARVHAA